MIIIFLWPTKEHQATSVTGEQIIINPLVWYSHLMIPMKNDKSIFKSMKDSDDRSK